MNSKKMCLFLTTLFISSIAFAGNSFISKNLKLKKIGIHMGVENDLLSWNGMQGYYFSSLLIDRELSEVLSDRRNANFNQGSGLCGIPNISVNFAFELPKKNRELQLGVMGIFDRALVNYFTQYDAVLNKHFTF